MKIPISKLRQNTGQIEGVPKNPRYIKDEKYELLKQSLADDPEFTNLNPILVIEYSHNYIVIGGNMRSRAAKELGWKEIEASVMPADTPVELIRARIIKHNADYGSDDWDLLANEWEAKELEAYGMDLPEYGNSEQLGDINGSDENAEWIGMPDFEPSETNPGLVITFDSPELREQFVTQNDMQISIKGKTTWSTRLPYREREDLLATQYE
jgi:hypothetical protein